MDPIPGFQLLAGLWLMGIALGALMGAMTRNGRR